MASGRAINDAVCVKCIENFLEHDECLIKVIFTINFNLHQQLHIVL